MRLSTDRPDICIVVLSCDKYSDLWPSFFELFFRFWPGCPFPIYLYSNRKTFCDPRVKSILSGDDPDWSTSIKVCLEQIGHRHVWMFFDDVMIDQPVDEAKISRLVDFVGREDPAYLRFRRFPRPEERLDRDFGRCVESSLYRTSVFAIWRREVLVELLRSGESAWTFEHESVGRSRRFHDFYGVYDEYFSYIHGVEKGVWIRAAVTALRRLGCIPDISQRALMSDVQHRVYLRASLKTFIFNRTPSRFKSTLLKLSSGSKKLIGKKK